MVIRGEEFYRDLIESLVEILEQESDDIPYDIKKLKHELFRNNSKKQVEMWCHVLREDIQNTIENLEEIGRVTRDIEDELNEEKELASD